MRVARRPIVGRRPRGLIADLRVSESALGEYSATSNRGELTPWPHGDLEGDGSKAVVYDAATAQSDWPAPYSWSPRAIAMTSVADGRSDRARVQVQSQQFPLGADIYIGFAVYLPSATARELPQYGNNNGTYLAVAQIFGAPFNVGAPVLLSIRRTGDQTSIAFGHTSTDDPGRTIAQAPMPQDQWYPVVMHVRLSTSARTTTFGGRTIPGGLLELWFNGVKQEMQALPTIRSSNYDLTGQSLSADGTTAYIATANTDTTAGEQFYLDNYRSAINPTFAVPKSITIFHAGAKIGSSYASVKP